MQPTQQSMNLIEVVNFISSVASLILAVGAISLSIVFYRMSTAASNATTEAAKGIAASVDRLEKLFDKLYSDTFSMMRDTVSDMRKHMWPTGETEEDTAEEVEKKADEKIADIKQTMEAQLSQMLNNQRLAEDKMDSLRVEMRRLLDRAMRSARQVSTEARSETIREHIIRSLRIKAVTGHRYTMDELVQRLTSKMGFPVARILGEIQRMREEGIIVLGSDAIGPTTTIGLADSPNKN